MAPGKAMEAIRDRSPAVTAKTAGAAVPGGGATLALV